MKIFRFFPILFLIALLFWGFLSERGFSGIFNDLVQFLSWSIESLAVLFNNSYGLSIIFLTIIVKLIIMPLMVKQYLSQSLRKDKMKILEPQIKAVKQKYTKDMIQDNPSLAKERDTEILKLYKEHNLNPFSLGCLPLLIQLPILIGVYYAIQSTPEIANHQFLWLELGKSDFLLSLFTGIIYMILAFVNKDQMQQDVPKYLSYIGFITPIIMFTLCLNTPAALPLYWIISGLFIILQTMYSKKMLNKIRKNNLIEQES
ncbi:membrane protein insertase YidC [Bacillus cereus]|uniref:membrane protein insertase YidC n=1 Tax=Bacillus cereus TaxID=1396 RepID=UPI003012DF18